MSKGCRVALIIFGIIFVLLVAAIIVGYLYCDRIGVAVMGKMVDGVEVTVLKDLPPGYTEENVKAEFDNFRDALARGALKDKGVAPKLELLGTEVKTALEDKKIDADELQRILESMREITSGVKD
jgi:hypothetical protein